jgi:hypothetical protein
VSVKRPASLAALLATLLGAHAACAADALYVVEQVVVSVNSSADGSGERVASLKSGDRVELIERAGESVHVRLPDGKDGWLRAIYVSGDEPTRPRLQQSEAEVARLKAEVSRLEAELAGAASVRGAAATPAAEESPVPSPAALFDAAPEAGARRVWPWAALTALLALAAGFALGWRTLDRTIRKKYGGLKIY